MILHSLTTTKGALRLELLDGEQTGRCYRIADSGHDVSALLTREEAESLRDKLNALIPAELAKVAA